jgi:hypothetical protein
MKDKAAICNLCGWGFIKKTTKQSFCSKSCAVRSKKGVLSGSGGSYTELSVNSNSDRERLFKLRKYKATLDKFKVKNRIITNEAKQRLAELDRLEKRYA